MWTSVFEHQFACEFSSIRIIPSEQDSNRSPWELKIMRNRSDMPFHTHSRAFFSFVEEGKVKVGRANIVEFG